jgi:hypothetical protein
MVICDIDNTIADATGRAIAVFGSNDPANLYKDRPQEEWDKFFSGEMVLKDPVIPLARECLEILEKNHDIYLCTGRRENRKTITKMWLEDNKVPYKMLIMRPEHLEEESNATAKRFVARELVNAYEGHRMLAFDDDRDCLAMYQELGFEIMKAPECWEALFLRIKP